jgi:hypothetical protein
MGKYPAARDCFLACGFERKVHHRAGLHPSCL